MKFIPIAKMGGVAVLTLGLAACMDVTMDLEILSESTARSSVNTAMAADMYAMFAAQEGEEAFCEDGELTETAATVDCLVTTEGTFAEIMESEEEDGGPMIEAIGNGQVRVSFPTADLDAQISEDIGAADDPEMMNMVVSMFEGNAITMSVSGGDIVDTNMELAEDGQSASFVIPFVGLLTGELELPDEIFAVVQK